MDDRDTDLFSADFDVRPFRGPRRRACLLTTLRPERGLAHTLLQHLSAEMPRIAFTLTPREDVSAIWVCGYEPGAARVVETLRRQYPSAILLVTGRGPTDAWGGEVTDAGADFALPWPMAYGRLERLLAGRVAPIEIVRDRRAGPVRRDLALEPSARVAEG